MSLAADNYGNNLRDAHTKVCSYTRNKFSLPSFYDDPTSAFNLSLTAAQNPPSKYQIALAISAAHLAKGTFHNRTLWELPAGSGKSRVIACLAFILLLTGKAQKIHIVFPNSALMNRDKKDYASYFTTVDPPLTDKVVYHSDLNFSAGAKDVVIIDEADYFIFEKT